MFIGQYEVVSELGEGGMGKVVLARSQSGRLVVIKQPFETNPEFREMLVNEARTGLRLRHPHIVETIDFFELDGQVSLVLSYVSGASLEAIRDHGPVPANIVCLWGQQIAEALEVIHNAKNEEGVPLNIVHRDVTPGNIMVGHDGNVRLIDLGIARADDSQLDRTKTGYLRGTLRYLAPEVFKLGEYTPQSDMWSLGISLLDAALGRPSIEGREAEIYAKVIDGRIFEFQSGEFLDPLLERALRKLLAQDPADRPKRAKDVAALFSMIGQDLKGSSSLAVQEMAAKAVSATVGKSQAVNEECSEEESAVLVEQAASAWGGSTAWNEDSEHALKASLEAAFEVSASENASGNDDSDRTEIFNRDEIEDFIHQDSEEVASVQVSVVHDADATDPDGQAAAHALNELKTQGLGVNSNLHAAAKMPPTGMNNGLSTAELDAFQVPVMGSTNGTGGQTQLRNYMSGIRSIENKGTGKSNSGKYLSADKEDPFPVILTAVIAGGLVLFTLLIFGIVLLVSNLKSTSKDVPSEVKVEQRDAGAFLADDASEKGAKSVETLTQKEEPEFDLEEIERKKKKQAEERRLRKLRAQMPACWKPGITKYFFYRHRGKTIIKQRFKEIPRRFKKRARCVN